MSSLTNTVPFSLDEINLRKKLVFPDGSIQSTAYTGSAGGATLAEVLADGDDANYQGIDNLLDLVITDAGGLNKSRIEQAGVNLQIDCGNLTSSVSSTVLFYTTDALGSSVQQMEIADAGVSIVPPVSLTSTTAPISSATQPVSTDSSNKMPTTAWVQSAIDVRDSLAVYTEENTPIAIANGYGSPAILNNLITLPTLALAGQYIIQFQSSFNNVGTVANPVCRETIVAVSGGQISGDTVVPYQYPNLNAEYGFLAGEWWVTDTLVVKTLVPNVAGLIIQLSIGWTNTGTVSCLNTSTVISYLGSY